MKCGYFLFFYFLHYIMLSEDPPFSFCILDNFALNKLQNAPNIFMQQPLQKRTSNSILFLNHINPLYKKIKLCIKKMFI